VLVRVADVVASTREALAVTGAKAGEHILWVRRVRGRGPLRGQVTMSGPNGFSRHIPFVLEEERSKLGTLQWRWRKRLVPVDAQPLRPVW
jgi:hypothetical protein